MPPPGTRADSESLLPRSSGNHRLTWFSCVRGACGQRSRCLTRATLCDSSPVIPTRLPRPSCSIPSASFPSAVLDVPKQVAPPRTSICTSRTVCDVAGATSPDGTWVPPLKSLSLYVTGTNLDVPKGGPSVRTPGLPTWETLQADGIGTDSPPDTHIPKARLAPAKPTKDKLLGILGPTSVSFPATGNGYYYCWFLTSVPSYRHRKLSPRDRLVQHTAKC